MQNNLIFLISISTSVLLLACGYTQLGESNAIHTPDFDFVYSIDDRFGRTVLKDKIDEAVSIRDIIPEKDSKEVELYKDILICKFAENRKDWVTVRAEDDILSTKQLEILQSLHYGSSFSITGYKLTKEIELEQLKQDTVIYYLTVAPAQPAAYVEGKEALITYLKENSQTDISIASKDGIQPGKISFTVNELGTIEKVSLRESSGYEGIDNKFLELINSIPGKWKSALNTEGNKVKQEITFFFGDMGC